MSEHLFDQICISCGIEMWARSVSTLYDTMCASQTMNVNGDGYTGCIMMMHFITH